MPRSVVSIILLCTLLMVNGCDRFHSKIHMGYRIEFTEKGTLFPSVSTYDVYAKIPLVHIPPNWETVTALALKNKCQHICILGEEAERVCLFLWPMYVKYCHMIYQKQKELYAGLTQSLPLILLTFKPEVEPPPTPPSLPLITNNQVHMQQLKTLLAEQGIQSDIVDHVDEFFKGLNPDPQTVSTLLQEKQAIQQPYSAMHENGYDAVSCENHHQDIWEALFP